MMHGRTGLLLLLAWASAATAQPPQVRDCRDCAAIALIPAGRFTMGADRGEPGRPDGPAHAVTIERPFGMAVTEVTNRQFARFVKATGAADAAGCEVWPKDSVAFDKARWQDPGYGREPRPDEPVACVSWNDARAYADWLAGVTGKPYRLPSEAEWEYAARAGTTTDFYWGDDPEAGCGFANLYDAAGAGRFSWASVRCNDGAATVAPVGRYKANAFGLHDMIGNVWEWVQDCHVVPYPADHGGQAAVEASPCDRRGVRGGSWMTRPDRNRVTFRGRDPADVRYFMFGFRVARDLSADEAARAAR
ncbi:formylglycine-generating enzyme family protein [Polymorphobacter sp.]|uniref:formylglycine-generating enzyme family protein n=1 Tax=Polymorphobacter sp. TaxID=1909290 RepID=UPI003F717D56